MRLALGGSGETAMYQSFDHFTQEVSAWNDAPTVLAVALCKEKTRPGDNATLEEVRSERGILRVDRCTRGCGLETPPVRSDYVSDVCKHNTKL